MTLARRVQELGSKVRVRKPRRLQRSSVGALVRVEVRAVRLGLLTHALVQLLLSLKKLRFLMFCQLNDLPLLKHSVIHKVHGLGARSIHTLILY